LPSPGQVCLPGLFETVCRRSRVYLTQSQVAYSAEDLKTRFEFLKTEATVALTLIRTSDINAESDPQQSAKALLKAKEALDVIKRFLPAFPFTAEQVSFLQARRDIIQAEINLRSERI
jgi:hypothetical protein